MLGGGGFPLVGARPHFVGSSSLFVCAPRGGGAAASTVYPDSFPLFAAGGECGRPSTLHVACSQRSRVESTGIEPATFRFLVRCLNKLRYNVSSFTLYTILLCPTMILDERLDILSVICALEYRVCSS